MTLSDFARVSESFPHTERMPALFVGHGNPMNAIEENAYTKAWSELGEALPTPKAILAISAHWITEGTHVHIAAHPRTIHDFWGFPEALSQITYACPGSEDAAAMTQDTIHSTPVIQDRDWGIDHGTWVPLIRMFPAAQIPVYQLSLDVGRTARQHYDLGRELASLRERGILILGSGNLVHNLGRITWGEAARPEAWAIEFDAKATELITQGDHDTLIAHEGLGTAAELSIPTPDHYWPLLSVLGASTKEDAISFPVEGIALGSISMRTVLFR